MLLASIPSDPITLLLALFAVFGLPLLIFGIVVLGAGYLRHDADRSLEDLEAELDAEDERVGTERTTRDGPAGERD